MKYLGDAYIRALLGVVPGTTLTSSRLQSNWSLQQLLKYGQTLRDHWIHQYSILPGAINSFVEVAVSREWMVTGQSVPVARAVERINNSFFVDSYGIVHRGWENVMSRMVLDWLTIGRCALHSRLLKNSRGAIEYLDSSQLIPTLDKNNNVIWSYLDSFGQKRELVQDDVIFDDAIRIGNSGLFLGKVSYLLPLAQLDWYVRQHLEAKLDGRRIRDIYFVADDQMVEAVGDALNSALALAAGEDSEKYGLPVVAVNKFGSTEAVEKMFARMGLSEIPEAFDLSDFESRYVNEIASVLGLSLRYFWENSKGGTNRAVEQINQERQAVQGPSYFVRSIERMMNGSTFLSSQRNKVRFMFEEEVDSMAAERKAKTLRTYAEGLQIVKNIVSPKLVPEAQPRTSFDAEGNSVSTPPPAMIPEPRENDDILPPEAIISFLERQGLLSTDIALPDLLTQEENGLLRNAKELEYGEVTLDREGRVVERRSFLSPVVKPG